MFEPPPPADEPTSRPWGPPPSAPPTLSPQQPYADPFAGMSTNRPPEPPKRRREGLWVALAAVVGAAAVIGAAAWYTQRDTADEAFAGRDVTPRTTQTVPEEPTGPDEETPQNDEAPVGDNAVCPEGTRQEVCDAARFVEDFRGRPFQTFPVVEFKEVEEFQERIRELNEEARDDETVDEVETTGEVLGSLGLIDPGVDLLEVSEQLLEFSVVGFYDPDSEELVVRGDEIDLYVELVIVHELVHAHDDQWLDIDFEQFEDNDDEAAFAYRAAIEGNAGRVESVWRTELSESERAELSAIEFGLLDADEVAFIQQLPSILLLEQQFLYRDGQRFATAVAEAAGGGDAGERAIDEVLSNPPTTTEETLHPDLFLSGHEVSTVPAPRASGSVVDQGVIGEFIFDIWLGDRVGDGWNGDRYVSFERDGQTCTVINVAADSGGDLDELFDAAADWVGDAEDGDLRRSDQATVDGVDVVVIEGCR